jgi:hypothetical protein
MAACGVFVAGILGLMIFAYMLLYLIPVLILLALLAAICSAVTANGGITKER